jgi:hypothetical protein
MSGPTKYSDDEIISKYKVTIGLLGVEGFKNVCTRVVYDGVRLRGIFNGNKPEIDTGALYTVYLFCKHWHVGGFIIAVDTRLYDRHQGDITDQLIPNPWCLGVYVRDPISILVLEHHLREQYLSNKPVDNNILKEKFSVTVNQPTYSQRSSYGLHPDLDFTLRSNDRILTVAPYDQLKKLGIICTGEVKGPIHFTHGDKTLISRGYFILVCEITRILRYFNLPRDIRKIIARLYLENMSRENIIT